MLALRDRGLLEAAVARPAMTFVGDDLYPDLAGMAAALMHSLVLNHPFVDGNKRVGAAAAEFFVECNGQAVHATDVEFEELSLAVATARSASRRSRSSFGNACGPRKASECGYRLPSPTRESSPERLGPVQHDRDRRRGRLVHGDVHQEPSVRRHSVPGP